MGDTTYLQMKVKSADPRVLQAAAAEFGILAWDISTSYDDAPRFKSLGGQCGCGAARELASVLDKLTYEDPETGELTALDPSTFAYYVWEDPKYEWLGELWVHVPGFKDFGCECDSNGTPQLDADLIADLIAEATDLDALKAALAKRTGTGILKAWTEWEPS